jgi:hypothetical protein
MLAVIFIWFNSLNAKLNPICHLLALLGAHHILHISRIMVKLTLYFLYGNVLVSVLSHVTIGLSYVTWFSVGFTYGMMCNIHSYNFH